MSTSLPHTRGGVSALQNRSVDVDLSSPRPWGCFLCQGHTNEVIFVFPTLVGVFLFTALPFWGHGRLPHTRGVFLPAVAHQQILVVLACQHAAVTFGHVPILCKIQAPAVRLHALAAAYVLQHELHKAVRAAMEGARSRLLTSSLPGRYYPQKCCFGR